MVGPHHWQTLAANPQAVRLKLLIVHPGQVSVPRSKHVNVVSHQKHVGSAAQEVVSVLTLHADFA